MKNRLSKEQDRALEMRINHFAMDIERNLAWFIHWNGPDREIIMKMLEKCVDTVIDRHNNEEREYHGARH